MTIGELIRARRQALGLAANHLAARLRVAPQQLYAWESGRRRPDADAMLRLAAALNVPIGELLEAWQRTGPIEKAAPEPRQ